ncbi:MAG TPA: hypothetical protein VGO47_03950 [Chlamydiales bacterium]|nr:hypothetical protein [Chlamydiales bacterium]
MADRQEDFSTWTYGTTTMQTRQEKNVDSGLWMLADVEAWYIGKLHAEQSTNMDTYRLIVRKAILGLPAAGEQHKEYPIMPVSVHCHGWCHEIQEIVVQLAWRPQGTYAVPRSAMWSPENVLWLDQ